MGQIEWRSPDGEKACGIEYDVTRGGWDLDPGPDTWLTEHLLARFEERRVQIAIEGFRA
jgi:hypothetical protein